MRKNSTGGAVFTALAMATGLACSVLAPARHTPRPAADRSGNWADFAGGPDSGQYSPLRQIDRTNVARLEPAWTFEAPGLTQKTAYNPVIVDGVMYALGPDQAIVALDAASGKMLWSYPVEGDPTCRGINYWESRDGSDRRLLFASNHYLQAIDARTGRKIVSFGDDGRVDLRQGIPRVDPDRGIQSNSPGRIFEDLLLVGSATWEEYDSPPGDIRAFDVRTGRVVWTFHTIPREGEYGYDTWPPEAWKRNGGTNVWGEISVDEKRGIAYFPVGSPTYDFYGANRKGANLFGNCVLALDARTGKRIWHFQAVHHDLWDYDLSPAPKLLTVTHEGRTVDVVAQATKSGFLYVLDRVTGAPLWPIEERPVPKSDVPGEESWPTQPFPSKPPPFARLSFSAEDLNPHVVGEDRERFQKLLETSRNEGVFTPPSRRGSIQIPGQFGGANFGCCAAEPATGLMYVKSFNAPAYNKLRFTRMPEMPPNPKSPERRGLELFRTNCLSCHAASPLRSIKEIGAERFRQIVRGGEGRMPAFAHFSAEQIDELRALVDFMTAMRQARASLENEADDAPPPTTDGETRFFGLFGQSIVSRTGLPVIGPPWVEIVAYDLNEGAIRWRKPLGTLKELAAKGNTDTGGRAQRNGPVATAGGLLFVGAASDNTVRALDTTTGDTLWEKALPGPPSGIPAVYETGGRQYVVFYTSAAGRSSRAETAAAGGTPPAYHAFALPVTDRAGGTGSR